MSKRFQLVRFWFGCQFTINRFRKFDFESGWQCRDLFDFKRNQSRPVQTLNGISFRAANRPAPIRAASDKVSIRCELYRQQSRVEAFAKRIASTLPDSVYFLCRGSHYDAEAKVGDEDLIFKRSELAARFVDHVTRNRAAHSLVRKHNRVRNQFLDSLAFDFQARRCVRNNRCFAQLGSEFVPVETDRMSHESTRFQNLQRAGSIPRPLAFCVEHDTVFVGADSTRAANTAANGNRFSIRCDLQTPTAKRSIGMVRLRQTQRDPNVAFRIRFGTERKFVIVPKSPNVAERLETIRAAVVVCVGDLCGFGLLSHQKGTVAVSHSENLIQATGILPEFRFRILVEYSFDQKDVATTRGDRQLFLVGHDFEAAGFDRQFLRQRNVDQFVVLGLFFTRAPELAKRFLLRHHCEQAERNQFEQS